MFYFVGLVEGRGRAGAGVFQVDHRNPADAQLTQGDLATDHFLALHHTTGGIGHVSCLDCARLDTRIGKRFGNRFAGQSLERCVQVFAEAGHPHTGNFSYWVWRIGHYCV